MGISLYDRLAGMHTDFVGYCPLLYTCIILTLQYNQSNFKMIQVLLYPDALSMVGSMNAFEIFSTSKADVVFALRYKGSSANIVQHTYTPNDKNRITLSVKDIILPLLSFEVKDSSEPYAQPNIMKSFVATLYEVGSEGSKKEFTFSVIRAGVDRLSDSATNFLKNNFLTWQPQVKAVTYYSPEFLTYYATATSVMKCKAYMWNGTAYEEKEVVLMNHMNAGTVYTVPVQYAIIAKKIGGSIQPSYYDIWVEQDGKRVTYVQRYYASDMKSEEEEWFLFENSLGGVDCFRAYGNSENTAEHTHNVAEIEEDSEEYRVDTTRKFKKNTGFLDKKERLWMLDFFPSLGKYVYHGNSLRKITVTESDVNYEAKELPSNYTFTYKYSDARPYLNLTRSDASDFKQMDIHLPEIGNFTIAPRLVEFPRQLLSGGVLFPVQEPYSETWGVTTADALFNYFASTLTDRYSGGGGIGHQHFNIEVLNGLSYDYGYILYQGDRIKAGMADDCTPGGALEKKMLRKDIDDTAKGKITFEDVISLLKGLKLGDGKSQITGEGLAKLYAFMTYNFVSGAYGSGASIDNNGDAEMNSLFVRQFISAPKFVFNEISVTKAEQWNTNGYGTIESVDTKKHIISLHLEGNDYGSLQVGDICRGIYADIDNVHGADKNTEGALDDCNFVLHKGFFTTYFYVKKIITSEKGKFVFEYGKRSEATPDPCAYMDFAQYGSFTDDKRQSSMYFSSRGNSYIEVLDGVCNWEVLPQNRVARYGWLGGLTLVKKDGSTVRPEGNGIYVQDNIYFGGNINYLQGLSGLDDLREEAKAYDVSLSQYQSVITVDDMGNVINGLYTEDEEKTTKQYRISTAVFVRKGMDILLEEDGNTEDVTAGHYRVHAVSEDCEVMVQNSTIFVTAIRNIKDGVAGTNDDANFDYDAMRKATDAMVTIVVELEGKTSKMVQMPIRIQHDTLPFMVCDLSNESASVAWNTKTAKYIGLPIKTKVSLMYHNEPWAISSLNISKVAGLKTSMSIEGKAKVITIDADNLTADTLAQITKMNITVVGRYAGANYEYTRELTILKSSDTVVYELIPSADSIVVDKDGNKTVNSVSCDVYATSSDDKRYKLTALPSGMSLKYGKSENATKDLALGAGVDVASDDKMVTFALYDKNNQMLDKESVPVLAFGKDGKGIEYIFKLQNSAPSNPTPSGYATDTEYQRTDYVPTTLGWTDDPSGVDAVNQYEWVCKRVSTNGHWGAFSEPAEYAHFGKHAPKAKSDDDIVTIPTDSKGKALVAFRESIQFQLLVDGLACTLTSVTMNSSTLTDVSCSISSNVANISCAEGASLGTTAQTIVFRVAGRLNDGSSYSDYVTVKVVPNVTGADGDGYEYIYYRSSSSSASSIPTPRRQNGSLTDGWQDDPMPPTVDEQYVYVAYKKGAVGSDGTFSAPKLFNRFPKSISKQETKFYTTSSLSPAPEAWKIWKYGSTSMPTDFNDSYPWLWKVIRTTYTDGTTDDVVSCEGYKAKNGTDGAPGTPGVPGAPGVGIDSIQTYYLISSLSSGITTSSSDWTTKMVNPTSSKPYLWSYVKTTLSNGDFENSTPVIIGNFAEAGVMGAIGCIIRPSIWKSGVVYLNESALTNKQEKYIDLVYVEDASANDGWRQYMCALTHTSASNNSPTSSDGSKYWTQLSDTGPIYAPLILAKNAVLNFTQGQQFNLVENGNIFASYRIPGSDGVALWLGGSTASSAPFSVDKNGSLKSTSGIIGGVEISQERLGVGVADVGNKTFKGAILSSEGIFTGYKSSYFGAGVFAADDPSGSTIQMYDKKALSTISVSSPSLYVRKYSPDSIILNNIDKYYGAALIVDVPKGVGVASLGNNVLGGLALSAVAGDLDIGSTDYLFQKNRGTVAYLTNSSGRCFYLPDNPHEGQVVIVIQGSTGNITFYHPGKRLVIQNTVKDSGGFYSGKQGQLNIFVYIGSMWYGTYCNG